MEKTRWSGMDQGVVAVTEWYEIHREELLEN